MHDSILEITDAAAPYTVSVPGNIWRKVHGRVTKRPTNFSWVVPDVVAGSGLPTTREEFYWLLQQGVGSVVSMTEEALPREWTDNMVSYLHVPTPDMAAPLQDGIDQAVDFMRECSLSGKPVVVHCAAGLGRAGTILACYMVKHQDMDASGAIGEIRRLRPGSVQSDAQEMAVATYYRRLARDV